MNPSAPTLTTRARLRRVPGALVVSALDAALLALALGGPRALLREGRALALVALWTATSLLLAWIRPPRAHDAERAPESPAVLLALVGLPLLTPALSAWTARLGVAVIAGGTALRWSGVALATLGLALRVAAIAQLGRRFSPRLSIESDHALETRGLYAWVRHPGYLGALAANLGAALAFASLVGVGLTLLLALAVRARVHPEERLLASRFGDEFEAYRRRTGALLPRFVAAPRPPRATNP